MRPRAVVAALGALVIAVALGACTKNTGKKDSGANVTTEGLIATDPKDSMGPAPEIEGATKGGTIYILREDEYQTLDPQRTYSVAGMGLLQLYTRTLTMFKEDGKGKITAVGDLAETPGKDVNKDCKVWEFTLKKGLKYEDGSEIKAEDVAHGVARSFEEDLDGGATYIQEWLADKKEYNSDYKGPFTSGQPYPPGLQVKDSRTLVFTFAKPHCDMPFAVAMPTTVPVPKGKDTRQEYNNAFASGPYKIKERQPDRFVELERNPHWDAKTDPIRHQYPDRYRVEIGDNDEKQTDRIIADQGNDAFAINEDEIPQARVKTVQDNPDLMKRATFGPTPFVWYLTINNERVTDTDTRRAINHALDKAQLIQSMGGSATGEPASTILSRATPGWQQYTDPYPMDVDKAKSLLKGQKPKLVLGYRNSEPQKSIFTVVEQSLERAGFDVVAQPIQSNQFLSTTKTRGNPYDVYITTWVADWPSAAATLPVLYDGRGLTPKGNNNSSYFNNDEVNRELDRLSAMSPNDARNQWIKLDEKIMRDHAPVVPIMYSKLFALNGSKVGGVFISHFLGQQAYYNCFAKK